MKAIQIQLCWRKNWEKGLHEKSVTFCWRIFWITTFMELTAWHWQHISNNICTGLTATNEPHNGLSTLLGSVDGVHCTNTLARNAAVSALIEGFLLSSAPSTSSIIFCNVVCKGKSQVDSITITGFIYICFKNKCLKFHGQVCASTNLFLISLSFYAT